MRLPVRKKNGEMLLKFLSDSSENFHHRIKRQEQKKYRTNINNKLIDSYSKEITNRNFGLNKSTTKKSS